MFGWLTKKTGSGDPEQAKALYAAVRQALGDDDDVHVRIVSSIAALLLCVAYADQDYAEEEERVLRGVLSRIHGLDTFGVEAINTVLRAHTVRITGAEASTYARELLDLTDVDFRVELLDALVDLAAADDVITVGETNMLRIITKAFGLEQAHYNRSQARHRDKLAVLGD
jgi:uncharacterized tellurite resistance protein B-like protein